MASNPVFDRIEKESRQGYAGFGRSGAPTQQPTAGMASTDGMSSQQLQDLYNQPSAGPVQTKRLTIDDVVMKTAGLFAIVLVFAVVGWQLAPTSWGPIAVFGGIAFTLVVGFVIAFKKTISVPLIVALRRGRGPLRRRHQQLLQPRVRPAGADRRLPRDRRAGRAWRRCRSSPACCWPTRPASSRSPPSSAASSRWPSSATRSSPWSTSSTPLIGNTRLRHRRHRRPGHRHLALRDRSGARRCWHSTSTRSTGPSPPARREKYSWLLAHGLIVTLVWLYLEILRLLGRLRSN